MQSDNPTIESEEDRKMRLKAGLDRIKKAAKSGPFAKMTNIPDTMNEENIIELAKSMEKAFSCDAPPHFTEYYSEYMRKRLFLDSNKKIKPVGKKRST